MLEAHGSLDPIRPESAIPLLNGDECAKSHGIEVLAQVPSYSRLKMQVRADMLNPHGICHGGMTFLLADTALAYACGGAMVTTSAQIIFPAPAQLGDTLTAECIAVHQGKKAGVFDVTVTTQNGTKVALVRGQTLTYGSLEVPGKGSGK